MNNVKRVFLNINIGAYFQGILFIIFISLYFNGNEGVIERRESNFISYILWPLIVGYN